MARRASPSSSDLIVSSDGLNPTTGECTIAFYLYAAPSISNGEDVFTNRISAKGQRLQIDTNGRARFIVYMSSTLRIVNLSSINDFPRDQWNKVVIKWNDGASANVDFYLNDLSSPFKSISGNFGSYNPGTIDFTFFQSTKPDLSIAHFGIWDKKLSTGELDSWSRGRIAAPIDLLAFYKFDGLNASTEPDLSGNGHHATVTGTSKADHAPVGFLHDFGWQPMAAPVAGGGGLTSPAMIHHYQQQEAA